MKLRDLATKLQRECLSTDYAVSIIYELTTKMAAKQAKDLDGCALYRPNSLKKKIFGFWLRHEVDIHHLCKKVTIMKYHQDEWATEPLNSIKTWLKKHCKGNYRLIVVPADEDFPGYHDLKRNRVQFSRADDAMAFKLRWL